MFHMKLTPPKGIVFLISLILAIIGLVVHVLGYFMVVPVLGAYTFWIMFISWLLLCLGVWLKGF